MSVENETKVLVVDDRSENLIMTKAVLRALDVSVLTADSGKKALSFAADHEFAVALIDVQMPEMDGFELATLLREDERQKGLLIVFFTAIDRDDDRMFRGYDVGAVDFLYKPVAPNVLRSKVKAFVDLHLQQRDLRRANEHINELNADLLKTNKRLEDFAHVLSHDIRQPLQSIREYLSLIDDFGSQHFDPQAESWLKAATGLGQRMDDMLQGLLDYSTSGANEAQSPDLEPIDCEDVFRAALGNLDAAINGTELTITHDRLPEIRGSKTQLIRLFQNLISNAIKYRREEPLKIHVGLEKADANWLFRIGDNGSGIKSEDRERVFQAFERADEGSEVQGTGIGLATCREIVEHHGGKIWVESEFGRGSEFCFTLPTKPAELAFKRPGQLGREGIVDNTKPADALESVDLA